MEVIPEHYYHLKDWLEEEITRLTKLERQNGTSANHVESWGFFPSQNQGSPVEFRIPSNNNHR